MNELEKEVRKIRKMKRIVTELHQAKPITKQSKLIDGAILAISNTIRRLEKEAEFPCEECSSVVKMGVCSGCKKRFINGKDKKDKA